MDCASIMLEDPGDGACSAVLWPSLKLWKRKHTVGEAVLCHCVWWKVEEALADCLKVLGREGSGKGVVKLVGVDTVDEGVEEAGWAKS